MEFFNYISEEFLDHETEVQLSFSEFKNDNFYDLLQNSDEELEIQEDGKFQNLIGLSKIKVENNAHALKLFK